MKGGKKRVWYYSSGDINQSWINECKSSTFQLNTILHHIHHHSYTLTHACQYSQGSVSVKPRVGCHLLVRLVGQTDGGLGGSILEARAAEEGQAIEAAEAPAAHQHLRLNLPRKLLLYRGRHTGTWRVALSFIVLSTSQACGASFTICGLCF